MNKNNQKKKVDEAGKSAQEKALIKQVANKIWTEYGDVLKRLART